MGSEYVPASSALGSDESAPNSSHWLQLALNRSSAMQALIILRLADTKGLHAREPKALQEGVAMHKSLLLTCPSHPKI